MKCSFAKKVKKKVSKESSKKISKKVYEGILYKEIRYKIEDKKILTIYVADGISNKDLYNLVLEIFF